jgi:hypothetical protein
MLEVLAILLIVAWLLGVLSAYTFGGAIHLLLAVAAVLLLAQWARTRRPRK